MLNVGRVADDGGRRSRTPGGFATGLSNRPNEGAQPAAQPQQRLAAPVISRGSRASVKWLLHG